MRITAVAMTISVACRNFFCLSMTWPFILVCSDYRLAEGAETVRARGFQNPTPVNETCWTFAQTQEKAISAPANALEMELVASFGCLPFYTASEDRQ